MRDAERPDKHTLGAALDRAARLWPDQAGWVFDGRAVGFAEMRQESRRVARALLGLGIRRGDVVALWLPNLLEFALCQYACAAVGAILTAANTRAKSFELGHILAHSKARLLIMVDGFLKHDFAGTLAGLCPEVEGSGGRVRAAAFPNLAHVVSLTGRSDSSLSWDDFLAHGEGVDEAAVDAAGQPVVWSDPVLLQYTSGTTAQPKGALLNHRYINRLSLDLLEAMAVEPGEAVYNTQPFYHIGGSCNAVPGPAVSGCCMVITAHYQPGEALAAIERYRCVARTGYGAMYIMEMNHPDFARYDLSSLRTGWCVGSPDLMNQVRTAMGIPGLLQIYGSTEANGATGYVSDSWKKRSESCGRALPGSEIGIRDPETGRPCAVGEVGEVVLRGPSCMNGYLDQPEETARVIDAEGWYHTGDLGCLDADGHLYFRGRVKDMMKVGGENVSAEEVERVVMQHPAVRQAAAFGMPDPRLQEVVAVMIETRAGASVDAETIKAFCAARVANFRVPRHIGFVTEWPMTGSGKIMKRVLKETLMAEIAAAAGAPAGTSA